MRKVFIFIIFLYSSLIADEFILKSILGKEYHVEMTPLSLKVKEFPNTVVILDFFGANCPPCIAEMPSLVKFQKTFAKNVRIIGIQSASKRNDKKMIDFAKKHHLNYPVINLSSAKKLIEYAQKNTHWNGALPFKLMYDFEGGLSYELYGMVQEDKLLEALHEL